MEANGAQSADRVINRRRSWTPTEERCLIEAFMQIITQGWKAENGFKTGFLMQLEAKMRLALPGTDIRGDPHINSKYNTWKRQYKEVFDTLKNSGFNWCSGTKMVLAPADVWDDLIKAHPGLKGVRDKSWPYYEMWSELFGRDTAGGVGSNDNEQRRRRVPHPIPTVNLEEVNDNTHANTHSPVNEPPLESATGTQRTSTPPAAESRKRKRIDGIEELGEAITAAWGKATDSMDKIAARLGCEMDQTDNRKILWKMISELPMVITSSQQVKATLAIGNHQKTLDMFHGMPAEERCEVVRLALEGMLI